MMLCYSGVLGFDFCGVWFFLGFFLVFFFSSLVRWDLSRVKISGAEVLVDEGK